LQGNRLKPFSVAKFVVPQMSPPEAVEIFSCDSTKFLAPYMWRNGYQEFPVNSRRSTEGMEVKPEELSFFLVYDGE
jgi:hypothetical protein